MTNLVLRRNIARNHIRNILVFATALSDYHHKATLFQYGARACSSLRDVHVSGRQAQIGKIVDAMPLDEFTGYVQTPAVLKIDVEGEELNVLRGAYALIEKFRPFIIVEVHFGDEMTSIRKEIVGHAYSVRMVPNMSSHHWPSHIVAQPT